MAILHEICACSSTELELAAYLVVVAWALAMVPSSRTHSAARRRVVVRCRQAVVLGVVIAPRILLEHGVGGQGHVGIVDCQELMVLKVLLVLHVESDIRDVLLGYR